MNTVLPAWFLTHGAPIHALDNGPVAAFWQSLPSRLAQTPDAILVISAHWQTATLTLSGCTRHPAIQYDFSGFAEELYRIRWPLPDGRDTGTRVLELLADCGLTPVGEADRAFDHGLWVPLCRAWPEMNIPVFQLSLVDGWQGDDYLQLGKKLAQLRHKNILLIASGSLTHNLHCLDRHHPRGAAEPWARAFMHALLDAMKNGDTKLVTNPWRLPHGRRALPTLEHYWPFVIITACSQQALTPMLSHWQYRTLAMHSFSTSDYTQGER